MAVLFALLTALANAVAVATQHVASTSGRDHGSIWRFILFLVRHPLWLFGWVALGGSLVFQALALHFGSLSLVQPFLVTELVMALVLRRVWNRQRIRTVTWVSAVVTSFGLALFLVMATPRAGTSTPSASSWIAPVLVCLVVAAALSAMGTTGRPTRRAALFAAATAVLWALEATFIKAVTATLSAHGIAGMFARWPLYAFVVAGLAGLVCEQTALHVGPLKVSQPFIVIVDPLVSIALGLWLYHERLHGGVLHLGLAGAGFLVMGLGVVALTRTSPDTMLASIPRT